MQQYCWALVAKARPQGLLHDWVGKAKGIKTIVADGGITQRDGQRCQQPCVVIDQCENTRCVHQEKNNWRKSPVGVPAAYDWPLPRTARNVGIPESDRDTAKNVRCLPSQHIAR